eukprot:Partr_v1_DN27422_c0_g1_i2_m71816 putative vacuolar import and degradation protein
MKFHRVTDGDSIVFKWEDSDGVQTSYTVKKLSKHMLDLFETTVLNCLFEIKNQKPHESASIAELEALRYDPSKPVPSKTKQLTQKLPDAADKPDGNVLGTVTGHLHAYDISSQQFVLVPGCADIKAEIIDCANFNYWFFVSSQSSPFTISQQLDNTMNPFFSDEFFSFIWNYYDDKSSLTYSWSIKFDDVVMFKEFRQLFGRCMYEALNLEAFKKVKDDDQNYLVSAYADDVEMSDVNEGSSDEEEYFSDEDRAANSLASMPEQSNEGKNSLLAVGYKNQRSFVVRGNRIGVFSHDHDDIRHSATINSIKTPSGNLFSPAKVMLHNQDASMVLMNPEKPNALYKMDLETAKVIEEWDVDENRSIVDFTPDSKYAQMTPQQTFVGMSHNALFRIDPRQSGKKIVDSQVNQYKSKNQFSASATTGKGELVVASDKGDVRLYNHLEKRAKTHLPGLGDPIVGVDVTEDGKWILATCKTYLLLMSTEAQDEQGATTSGFSKSLASKKPVPKRLQLKPEHVAWINEPIAFTTAKFNTGDDMERRIVTSTGSYVITWNFRRVKAGHRYDYSIKKYPDKIVADNFRYGSDSKVIVTLPDNVTMASKNEFLTPQKLLSGGTPTQERVAEAVL